MESWVQSWWPRTTAFCDFSSCVSKVLRLPGKSEARSYKVLHLSRKIIFPNLKISCSKMQPFSGNLRPDLPTSLMNMSLVLRLPCEMHLSNVPRLPSFLEVLQKPSRFAHFWQGAQSPAPATKNDIWTSKSAPYPSVFSIFELEMCSTPQGRALFRHVNFQKCSDILTWKRAWRHSGAHFFDISASKSAPRLRCFVHFDLEMCFAPQWRATFHPSSGQMAPHPPL